MKTQTTNGADQVDTAVFDTMEMPKSARGVNKYPFKELFEKRSDPKAFIRIRGIKKSSVNSSSNYWGNKLNTKFTTRALNNEDGTIDVGVWNRIDVPATSTPKITTKKGSK